MSVPLTREPFLDAIYQHPDGISRAELARSLNMSKPSMADNATALLDIGIIEEIREKMQTLENWGENRFY